MERRLKRRLLATMASGRDGRRPGTGAQSYSWESGPEPGRGTPEDLYQESDLGRPPVRRAEESVPYGQEVVFGTLSICTLCRPTVHRQISDYMRRRGVCLLALQETRLAQVTQYVVDDCLFVLAGHGGAEREHAGIGVVLDARLRRSVTGFAANDSGRILCVGVDMAPRQLTVVVAYAPQSGRPEEERRGYFAELDEYVARFERKGHVLVLGGLLR